MKHYTCDKCKLPIKNFKIITIRSCDLEICIECENEIIKLFNSQGLLYPKEIENYKCQVSK